VYRKVGYDTLEEVKVVSKGEKTVLYSSHVALGAKMVEFGGWEMPVQYKSILEEHRAVRTTAGIFDVSHMGELEISGSDSLAFLQRLLTNDLAKMTVGQAVYSLMCYPTGGIVDDLLVYKLAEDKYWLVVNAGNKAKDLAWLREQLLQEQQHKGINSSEEVKIQDRSEEIGLLALQGPLAEQILNSISSVSLVNLKYYHFVFSEIEGTKALISRTGYTGEDGFEIYLAVDKTPLIWDKLLQVGKEVGLVPAGLGARDTLRFEAGLSLYGQELTETVTPLEAGLGFFVAWHKDDFIGKEVLLKQKKEGLSRKLVGFLMLERGIPREGYLLEKDGVCIGKVTSGSYAPTLEKNLGLGYVINAQAFIDNEISVVIRGKRLKAKIIKKPFYKRGR
jgi:aminomethyltransferase